MARSPNLFFLFLVIGLAMMPPVNAQALETDLELAVGYDDNVPKSSEPEDSSFALYRIRLAQLFSWDALSADGDVFLEGEYHEYFRLSDKYQLKTGASLGTGFANDRLLPRIFCEGLLYRDNYVEDDDRNEIMIGGQADWIVNARLTLGIRQTISRADYRNPALICSEPLHSSQMGNGNGNGNGMMMGHRYCRKSDISRDDDFYATGLQGTVYLSPETNTVLSLEHNRLDSSVATESFLQNGVNLSFLWIPADVWEVSVNTAWRHFDYDESSEDADRTDTRYLAGFGVSRFIKNIELFFHTEWTKNDSDSASESYRQTVTKCGVNLSF